MPKKILSVGFELAGNEIGFADFTEKKSLLDWDIVLFRPDVSSFVSYRYDNSEYMGKLALNDRKSFEMREANAHGVFGVEREDGAFAYIYNVNYDVKRLKILISRLEREAPRLVINPAFWAGLEIRPARPN